MNRVQEGSWTRAVTWTLAALWLIGTLRALLLCMHDPLYAYANSYDETRYTSCFHFYPDRRAGVAPELHSPEAPFAHFRFIEAENPMCYWSSELVFTGATALIWKSAEVTGGSVIHDVRWAAALRWAALLAVSIAFSVVLLRRNDTRAALANAALVPVVFADPGNTLYLATFYAEWTALIAAYALIGLVLLWRDEPRARFRFALLALAAFALATSKMQHMLLPLAVAAVIFLLDRMRLGRTTWRVAAVACGALLGAYFQFVQTTRQGPMMDTIRQYNSADVVFTALLPFADDPRALLAEIGIDPGCAIYNGKRAWQLPDLPERACRGLGNFTRGKELGVLMHHPRIAARLFVHGIPALDPWIAEDIGHVEGGQFEKVPTSMPSIGRVLHAVPAIQFVVLGLPLLALMALLMRPGARTGSTWLDATALAVTVMIATLVVTLLGDGLADTGKQGHLVVNAALAWLVGGLIMCVPKGRSAATTAQDRGQPPLRRYPG